MADKYMQLVLTPSVQQAQDKYFGKHQTVENAPETDALNVGRSWLHRLARQLLHGDRERDRLAIRPTPRRSIWVLKDSGTESHWLRGF
jgi:hypothetical protein